uniref:AGC-kinase C-terminal domain-containing protein n=1 Tax=Caenorhabditis tropicalis TaxID=1561998 RepID=A0A1I7U0P1_9PELO
MKSETEPCTSTSLKKRKIEDVHDAAPPKRLNNTSKSQFEFGEDSVYEDLVWDSFEETSRFVPRRFRTGQKSSTENGRPEEIWNQKNKEAPNDVNEIEITFRTVLFSVQCSLYHELTIFISLSFQQ